jgi:hypothetical protein
LQRCAHLVTLSASFGAVDAPVFRQRQGECHLLDVRQWLKVKVRQARPPQLRAGRVSALRAHREDKALDRPQAKCEKQPTNWTSG